MQDAENIKNMMRVCNGSAGHAIDSLFIQGTLRMQKTITHTEARISHVLRNELPILFFHTDILPDFTVLSRGYFNFFMIYWKVAIGKEKNSVVTLNQPGEKEFRQFFVTDVLTFGPTTASFLFTAPIFDSNSEIFLSVAPLFVPAAFIFSETAHFIVCAAAIIANAAPVFDSSAHIFPTPAGTFLLAPDTFSKIPGTFNKTPGTFSKTPGTFSKTPGTFGKTPGTFDKTPGTFDETPGTFDKTPGTFSKTPGTFGKTPGTFDKTPGTFGKTPGTFGKIPVFKDISGSLALRAAEIFLKSHFNNKTLPLPGRPDHKFKLTINIKQKKQEVLYAIFQ